MHRRLRLPAFLVVPVLLVACLDDDNPLGPLPPRTQLSPFDVAVRVEPGTVTRGSPEIVTVYLRNPTDTAIRVQSRDGCPVFEPLVQSAAEPNNLLVFAPGGCAARTETIDARRLDFTVAPRDTIEFEFAIDGSLLPTSTTSGSPQARTCMPAGPFQVLLVSPTTAAGSQAGDVAVVQTGPDSREPVIALGQLVEAPFGTPPPCP